MPSYITPEILEDITKNMIAKGIGKFKFTRSSTLHNKQVADQRKNVQNQSVQYTKSHFWFLYDIIIQEYEKSKMD
jgi:hypothetical protein